MEDYVWILHRKCGHTWLIKYWPQLSDSIWHHEVTFHVCEEVIGVINEKMQYLPKICGNVSVVYIAKNIQEVNVVWYKIYVYIFLAFPYSWHSEYTAMPFCIYCPRVAWQLISRILAGSIQFIQNDLHRTWTSQHATSFCGIGERHLLHQTLNSLQSTSGVYLTCLTNIVVPAEHSWGYSKCLQKVVANIGAYVKY